MTDEAKARAAAAMRARRQRLKVEGKCTRCADPLPPDHERSECRRCIEVLLDNASAYRRKRRRSDPAWAERQREKMRVWRAARRLAGLCLFCPSAAAPGRGGRCTSCADRHSTARVSKRAKNAPGRAMAVLLDFLVDAAPTYLEAPVTMKELLARVVETYGSVSSTAVGAERRMHRALVALVQEGRLERVTGRGQVAGYRRPPRQMRQRVSVLSSSQSTGGQVRMPPVVDRRSKASRSATVVNQDSRHE